MSIHVKHYPQTRICDEYFIVIDFLKKYGAKRCNNWHWGRWEWGINHPNVSEAMLSSIGLFMDDDELVGIVTRDLRPPAYIVLNPDYSFLKSEMVDYAASEQTYDGVSSIYADENDEELISIVTEKGYSLAEKSEHVLEIGCSEPLSYHLRDDFFFTDYATDRDAMKRITVIRDGFENDWDPSQYTDEDILEMQRGTPYFNPELAVFVVAPGGEYAAHCGMWYLPDTEVCYVEPVVTIPKYRKLGLGRAVVLECINRCARMGAKKAIVLSNQQFYYQIGFRMNSVHHLWRKVL